MLDNFEQYRRGNVKRVDSVQQRLGSPHVNEQITGGGRQPPAETVIARPSKRPHSDSSDEEDNEYEKRTCLDFSLLLWNKPTDSNRELLTSLAPSLQETRTLLENFSRDTKRARSSLLNCDRPIPQFPQTEWLSWSVLSHVLSEEQSKDGSDGASDDGRLTIVQCHYYYQPPSSDLYRSSIRILPPLCYHQNNLHSYHCHYQPTPCAFYHSTTTAPPCSAHVPCSRPITLCTHQSRGHEPRSPQGPARIYVGILRHHPDMSLLVICSFYYHILFTITPYMLCFVSI